jgi:hypothetical protein
MTFDTQLMFLSLFLIFSVIVWTRLQVFFQQDAVKYQSKKLIESKNSPINLNFTWNVEHFRAFFSNKNYVIETIKGTLFAYKHITHLNEKKLKKPLLEIYVWLDFAESLEYGVRTIESSFQSKGKIIKNLSVITFETCDYENCKIVESGFSFEKTAHYFLTIIPVGIDNSHHKLHVLHSNTFYPSIFFKHAIDVIYQSTLS